MFRLGKPRPENTWSDEEWRGLLNEGQCRWMRQEQVKNHAEIVRNYIEHGIDLPEGFNNA